MADLIRPSYEVVQQLFLERIGSAHDFLKGCDPMTTKDREDFENAGLNWLLEGCGVQAEFQEGSPAFTTYYDHPRGHAKGIAYPKQIEGPFQCADARKGRVFIKGNITTRDFRMPAFFNVPIVGTDAEGVIVRIVDLDQLSPRSSVRVQAIA